MAHDLTEALDYLLAEEGGFSNHKADRGGKTMYGVTQVVYTAWLRDKSKANRDVAQITKEEAFALYEDLYWNKSGCDKLPWPISYLVFDAAVNSGVTRSVKWLQAGLNLPQDGAVGPKTIAAAERAVQTGDGKALLAVVDARVEFLARLVRANPSQGVFLLGWWRRTLRVLARALLSD